MGVMMSVESSSSIEVYLISALFTPRENWEALDCARVFLE